MDTKFIRRSLIIPSTYINTLSEEEFRKICFCINSYRARHCKSFTRSNKSMPSVDCYNIPYLSGFCYRNLGYFIINSKYFLLTFFFELFKKNLSSKFFFDFHIFTCHRIKSRKIF
ncbi:hypothetical protein TUBRATIS_10060 [Tubulinosema ratisbonensis]|uniref:Uncharacterized protein n=1 Tax=Tubulinosema ratisbonensis TaxID=291195 RepID=A0A437ANC2_9MICR|nr:hypothetical protein TUBRATIS_10060 [Tubulinosema ratisbonensis]